LVYRKLIIIEFEETVRNWKNPQVNKHTEFFFQGNTYTYVYDNII